jgi:hypothetical protein
MKLLRRHLVTAWLVAVSGLLAWVAFVQAESAERIAEFDEISVQRINIVEPDGKPRVIISNRERMAGLYWGGEEYRHHNRDAGGFLFFNDDGDEVGGMTFMNRRDGDDYGASSSLKFDQYKQQESLELAYSGENGQHMSGLRVYDQPNRSIFPAVELSARLANAQTEEERARVQAELQALGETLRSEGAFAQRFFAGKSLGDSVVRLADGKGRPRLVLRVDRDGEAVIEFLDEDGEVVQRIPES